MDISHLAQSVTTYLVPLLPYLLKAGEKAAEESGKRLAGEAWDGAKALWNKLWPKVEAKPAALEAAEDSAQAPEDTDLQAVLRVQLGKLLKEDPSLAEEIESLLVQAKGTGGSRVSADRGGVAYGDNARDNIAITGGVGGDFVKGDKHKP
jgi:hypothetical protein